MGAFWESWQLWQKMCFVLGVAILVTVLLGCCKLIHTHWKMRKFTKVAAEQVETEEVPTMQQRRGRKGSDNDIPFGVRAIESGVEVEGVWISRGNSPANSTPGSPRSRSMERGSPKRKTAVRMSSISSITMPKPVHPYSSQASDSSQNDTISMHSVSPENSRRSSRNTSPNGHYRSGPRQSYKPRQSSHLRYSSGHFHEQPLYAGGEPSQSGNNARFDRSPSGSSTESVESSHSLNGAQSYQPKRHLHSQSRSSPPLTDARRSEIDLMPFTRYNGNDYNVPSSHRRSHTAETGYLLPARSRTSSTEWISTARSAKPAIAEEAEEPVSVTRSTATDPFRTPTLEGSVASEYGAPSFKSFLESDPSHSRQSFSTPRQETTGYFPINTTPGDLEAQNPATEEPPTRIQKTSATGRPRKNSFTEDV